MKQELSLQGDLYINLNKTCQHEGDRPRSRKYIWCWRYPALWYVSALLLAMLAGVGQADVFGLKKGMSLEQIRVLEFGELVKIESSPIWQVSNPRTPKGADIAAFLLVPDKGLLKVVIIWNIETNSHGDGIKQKFGELKEVLSDKYGKGKTLDRLKQGSMWDKPQYWMRSLETEERVLLWGLTDGITDSDKNKLTTIGIEASASTGRRGTVTLSYEFEGWSEYVDEKNKKEESEF